ncbi:7042_t:CDS:2, partial [Diversispora eburnea]
MSNVHKYFNSASEEWNIRDFMKECDVEPFENKLDCYTKSLEAIIERKKGDRKEKAQLLFDRYKKASGAFILEMRLSRSLGDFLGRSVLRLRGQRPDRQIARSGLTARYISTNQQLPNPNQRQPVGSLKKLQKSDEQEITSQSDEQSIQLDSSSEYIPTDKSDESEVISVRRKKCKKTKLNSGQSTQFIPTDNDMKEDSYTEIQETGSNNHIDQQQSSQHEIDPLGVTTNDEMDLPETCEEIGENEIELDLQEPSVVHIIKGNSEGLDWDAVMQKVEAY